MPFNAEHQAGKLWMLYHLFIWWWESNPDLDCEVNHSTELANPHEPFTVMNV